MENAKAEQLASFNSKEKYVFVIKTLDFANSTEKNYILKAKSTMDMNGWIFAINSQAFVCTENKRLLEMDQNLRKIERKTAELTKANALKLFSNFEEFMQSELTRSKAIKKTAAKSLSKSKFSFLFEILELYFKIKEARPDDQADAVGSREILFKTLKEVFESTQGKKQTFEAKGYKIEIREDDLSPELAKKLLREITGTLELEKVFSKKLEGASDKWFWDDFEHIVKPKLLDFLRKSEEMKGIMVDFLAGNRSPDFDKPFITDLRNINNNIFVARKGGKRSSHLDVLSNSSASPKTSSVNFNSMFRSNADLNK